MKKLCILLSVLCMAFGFNTGAKAITLDGTRINFDDSPTLGLISDYHGFTWTNLYVYPYASGAVVGYGTGLLSAPNEAYNLANKAVEITKTGGGSFSFSEIWLTSVTNDNLNVKIEGFLNGSSTGFDIFLADTSGPTYINYTGSIFANIDKLRIEGLNNIPAVACNPEYEAPKYDIFDYQFVLDAPVPEPTSMLLGLLGLGGAAGFKRKRA